jgi:hypothetical protein
VLAADAAEFASQVSVLEAPEAVEPLQNALIKNLNAVSAGMQLTNQDAEAADLAAVRGDRARAKVLFARITVILGKI